jgi:hypothetical protein
LHFILLNKVSYGKGKNFSNGVDWDKLQASELSGGSFNPPLSQEFLYVFLYILVLYSELLLI